MGLGITHKPLAARYIARPFAVSVINIEPPAYPAGTIWAFAFFVEPIVISSGFHFLNSLFGLMCLNCYHTLVTYHVKKKMHAK